MVSWGYIYWEHAVRQANRVQPRGGNGRVQLFSSPRAPESLLPQTQPQPPHSSPGHLPHVTPDPQALPPPHPRPVPHPPRQAEGFPQGRPPSHRLQLLLEARFLAPAPGTAPLRPPLSASPLAAPPAINQLLRQLESPARTFHPHALPQPAPAETGTCLLGRQMFPDRKTHIRRSHPHHAAGEAFPLAVARGIPETVPTRSGEGEVKS